MSGLRACERLHGSSTVFDVAIRYNQPTLVQFWVGSAANVVASGWCTAGVAPGPSVAPSTPGGKHLWVLLEHEVVHPSLLVDLVDAATDTWDVHTLWVVISREVAPQVMALLRRVIDARLAPPVARGPFDPFDWVVMTAAVA